MKLCLSLLLGGVLLMPALAAEQPARGGLEAYLKLLHYAPVAYKSNERNRPLLEGEINGKKLVFLVDTGCTFTMLSPASAGGLKSLGELGVVLEDSLLGKLTNADIVLMEKLAIGKAQFVNQPARVKKLQMDFVRLPLGGILGCDFFCRNFCLIDCGTRQIFFRGQRPSAAESEALEETLRRSGFTAVPMTANHALTIEAVANHQPLVLLVDTGATFSVLDESEIERLGLKTVRWEQPKTGSFIPEDVSTLIVGFGGIGAHQMRVTTLRTFEVGARSWKDVHIGVAELKAWGIAERGGAPEVQGLFGAEMLAGHGALIDFSSGKLWLRPEGTERPK